MQKDLIIKLKKESTRLPIMRNGEIIGWLRTLGIKALEDDSLVEKLASWREKHKQFFLTVFPYDVNRTRKWVENVVLANHDRILFLVEDADYELLGNYGLCDIDHETAQIDNTLKGEEKGSKGIFSQVERTILHFAFNDLKVKHVYCQVFSNNKRAIEHHLNNGMSYISSRKLKKNIISETEYTYIPIADDEESNVDFLYNKYAISSNDFYKVKEQPLDNKYL